MELLRPVSSKLPSFLRRSTERVARGRWCPPIPVGIILVIIRTETTSIYSTDKHKVYPYDGLLSWWRFLTSDAK